MGLKLLLLGLIGMGAVSGLQLNHQGNQAWYYFDEGPNGNRCGNNDHCDGQRTCSGNGWCQGTSRPPKNANYHYDEGKSNPPNTCNPDDRFADYHCDGNRTCSPWGYCQGTSR